MDRRLILALGLLALAGTGCRQDMHDQPKYKAYRASTFFGDERSARPLLEDTVARGQLREDEAYFTGRQGTAAVDVLPVPVTPALLRRGQERYGIYCTPCHGQIGRGDGMVVQRGYRRPPSFHIDRLRNETPGYIYDVITKGFGAMPDYATQVPVADRWAIVAYIRVLQLSENARLADVPPQWRASLATAPRSAPAPMAQPGAAGEPAGAPASAPPPSARPVEPR
jgi:mono/diheme cytochrome c family protein